MKDVGVQICINSFSNIDKYVIWLQVGRDLRYSIAEIAPMMGVMKTPEEILDNWIDFNQLPWINPINITFITRLLVTDKVIQHVHNYGTTAYYDNLIKLMVKKETTIKGLVLVRMFYDENKWPFSLNGLLFSIGSLEKEVIDEEIERWRRYLVFDKGQKALYKIDWEMIDSSKVVYLC